MRRLRQWLSMLSWALLRLSIAGNGRAIGTLSVWLLWERLTTWWWRLHMVRSEGIIRYSVVAHAGPTVHLTDGTTIRPGDRLLELHFDNRRLLQLARSPTWTPFLVVRLAAEDLIAIDRLLANGELAEVVALHGVTLFARPGRRLGFEVRPLPHTPSWGLVRYFLVGLLAVYHPRGWAAVWRRRQLVWPGELWLSRHRLHAMTAERLAKRRRQPADAVDDRARPGM